MGQINVLCGLNYMGAKEFLNFGVRREWISDGRDGVGTKKMKKRVWGGGRGDEDKKGGGRHRIFFPFLLLEKK